MHPLAQCRAMSSRRQRSRSPAVECYYRLGASYRNKYYAPQMSGKQRTAKIYNGIPGTAGSSYIRSLRHHEIVGPALNVIKKSVGGYDFTVVEVPHPDNLGYQVFCNATSRAPHQGREEQWLELVVGAPGS